MAEDIPAGTPPARGVTGHRSASCAVQAPSVEWGAGGKWAQDRDEDDVPAPTLPSPHGPQPRVEARVLALQHWDPQITRDQVLKPRVLSSMEPPPPAEPAFARPRQPKPADLELCAGTWKCTLDQHEGGAAPGTVLGSPPAPPRPRSQTCLPTLCTDSWLREGEGCGQQLRSHRVRGALGAGAPQRNRSPTCRGAGEVRSHAETSHWPLAVGVRSLLLPGRGRKQGQAAFWGPHTPDIRTLVDARGHRHERAGRAGGSREQLLLSTPPPAGRTPRRRLQANGCCWGKPRSEPRGRLRSG